MKKALCIIAVIFSCLYASAQDSTKVEAIIQTELRNNNSKTVYIAPAPTQVQESKVSEGPTRVVEQGVRIQYTQSQNGGVYISREQYQEYMYLREEARRRREAEIQKSFPPYYAQPALPYQSGY